MAAINKFKDNFGGELIEESNYLSLALVTLRGFKQFLSTGLFAPYKRIVLLNVALLFGGIPVALLGSPWPLLALLVIGKLIMDVWLHRKEHQPK